MRLRDRQTIDGSDNTSWTLRSAVLSAAPVSFWAWRKVSIVKKSIVVELVTTVRRTDVVNVLVGFLRWIERPFDVLVFHLA